MSIDVRSSAQRVLGEREQRLHCATSLIRYGVPFLDKALIGMRQNDLLLIGASSGAGKSEFCAQMAKVNVEAGKRVHFFALEAEDREVERRSLYKIIANLFFRDPHRPKINIGYRDWLYGFLDSELEQYETEAQKIFDQKYSRLHTIYRVGEFKIDQFEKALDQIRGSTDLVIIDHLNYFDFHEGENENMALTKIVKRIRDLALIHAIPMVLVAHIRKKDSRAKAIMPGLEDFMGSSNVYKIATQAVLLAGAAKDDSNPTRWPTYMRIAKDRVEGANTRFIAKTYFNSERNEYDADFQLGYWRDGMEQFEPLRDFAHCPRWARPGS